MYKNSLKKITYDNGLLSYSEDKTMVQTLNDIAIVTHLYYVDVWMEIQSYLERVKIGYDLFITVTDNLTEKELVHIIKENPNANIYLTDNRGRDVLPFLHIMSLIGLDKYKYICKLHTKKSISNDNGDVWRKLLYYDLIGSDMIVKKILETFTEHNKVGQITGKNVVLDSIKYDFNNNLTVQHLSKMSNTNFSEKYKFSAGTMFWIRPEILKPIIILLQENKLKFENESGQTDNTLAHAVERFFGFLCKVKEYEIIESSSEYQKLPNATLEELAALAFFQRFEYGDLLTQIQIMKQQIQQKEQQIQEKEQQIQEKEQQIQEKEQQIQEKEQILNQILNSKSIKLTHPLRQVSLIVNTLKSFNKNNLYISGTNEHRVAQGIKRRIPEKVYSTLKRIINKNSVKNNQDLLWTKPLKNKNNHGQHLLIVAELSIPQCKKYRVDQKVEMLASLGYSSTVVSWTDYLAARQQLQLSGLVIFYRVPAHDNVKALIAEADRLGIDSFFDVDDLVFEKELLKKNINILQLDKATQQSLFDGADLYKETLSLTAHSISSTPVLSSYMQKYNEDEAYVVPNCLDEELLKHINNASKTTESDTYDQIVKVVYGSGTSTHDTDFLEVSDALLFLLKKHANLRFVIHGTLSLPSEYKLVENQVIKIPFMKADKYYASLQTYDINIAPLEPSVFNDAKSNIKYLEASVFKLPTVASAVTEYTNVINNAQDGFVVNNKVQWQEALEKLILDKILRKTIGQNAYEKVLKEYRIEAIAKQYFFPLLEKHLPSSNSKRKKVLMANVLFNPISFGGATIVIEELSKLINQYKGFDVTVFTGFFDSSHSLHRDYDLTRYEVNGVSVILMRFPEPMLPEMEYKNELMEEVFDNILVSLKPDLVHFHSIQQLSATIAKPCIKRNIPYMITLHDMWWLCEKQFMVMPNNRYCFQTKIDSDYCINHCTHNASITNQRNNYLKPILHNASLLLTPSTFQKEMYLHNGIKQSKIKVNKNGILFPSKKFKKTRAPKGTIRFAYLGGNAVHKGYHFIKVIFESIESSNYELILTDLHIKLGHSSIFKEDWNIKGKLTICDGYEYGQKGLDDFFKDVDVLLFPSQWKESFGLTVREALVRDIWILSTDAGGVIEDIKEDENGNIVSIGNKEAFKEKVEDLLKKPSFFNKFSNPYKSNIRSYKEQAEELSRYYE